MATVSTPHPPSVASASQPGLTLTTHNNAGISAVRRHLSDALQARNCAEHLIDAATLVATELISNALQHTAAAGTPTGARLDVHWDGRRLLLAVTDPDPRPPAPCTSDAGAEHGRGLALLDALATDWGTRPVATGKTVWCHLA
ncbi:ATP-binding protein [Kitasatospora sp. NBC_00240]|uniref:ATP-binding protein n=1 Tax=Kitasatospora sp. NBC_00240 TaxID=2903567 RepID=UPI00224E364A|nr:ATP-binding protein [Kitasatospora sp. NBC_00240]MCX5208386.1 ATP-binding protein [Kitasatospora sp. NBC_00240]